MRPVLLLVAILLFAACGETTSSQPESASTSDESTTTTTSAASEPAVTAVDGDGAVVVEVVDGDTVEVELAGGRETVRLIGINTPERGECLADRAGRWLRERIGDREVELVADSSDRDQHGRLLRYVEVDGADVGAELIREGLALARRYPPDTARADEYEAVEDAAQDAAVGMWAADACGDETAGAELAISEVRFDADGDDNENLNDEWVQITNRGGSAVAMTGWVLKDTSATHRYAFPRGFVLEPGADVTVRTGCGADTATDLHWCNEGSAVWNNSGDTAFVLDPAGGIVSSMDG
jgi:micrococcal nuclease